MDALKKLEKATAAMRQRPELMRQAREEGATWEQIAAASGMSRAGAIKMHNTVGSK